MEKSIIVPFDFSEPAKNALEKAGEIAKTLEKPIVLIHVVKRKSDAEGKQAELDQAVKDFQEKQPDIKIEAVIRKGSLFKTIYATAQEYNAYLAVMGTHGKKTIKKAMKVVSKFIKIAFLLVQEPKDKPIFNKILVPLDSNQKTRANLNWVKSLSRHFDLEVILLYPVFKGDEKNSQVRRNLKFAEKILEKELIDYKVIRATIANNYADEIFKQARELDVDTLTLMSTSYKRYIKKMKEAESLQAYKETPILCVNPRIDLEKFGGIA
jgi:nucleotide-binding universal stress UspA family protein